MQVDFKTDLPNFSALYEQRRKTIHEWDTHLQEELPTLTDKLVNKIFNKTVHNLEITISQPYYKLYSAEYPLKQSYSFDIRKTNSFKSLFKDCLSNESTLSQWIDLIENAKEEKEDHQEGTLSQWYDSIKEKEDHQEGTLSQWIDSIEDAKKEKEDHHFLVGSSSKVKIEKNSPPSINYEAFNARLEVLGELVQQKLQEKFDQLNQIQPQLSAQVQWMSSTEASGFKFSSSISVENELLVKAWFLLNKTKISVNSYPTSFPPFDKTSEEGEAFKIQSIL
jgi:hypothetical protein